MTPSDNPQALVTGGSRGIGRATVEALATEGYDVHFCSRSPDSVERASAELEHRFDVRIRGHAVDVRDQGQVEAWVAASIEAMGALEPAPDVLVNNAGIGHFGAVTDLSGDHWREVIEVNLNGAFYVLRSVARFMKTKGRGLIFNVGSLASRNAFAGGAAYNASKFGLLGLTEAAMLDLRDHGVRVVAVLPGSVDTDFHSRPDKGWMIRPEDVARAVVDCLGYPSRTLPSRIELRPTRPPS